MELRSSTLSAFFENLNAEFNKAYTSASPRWPELAMKITSTSESNVYGWMEQIPGFREWIGPRVFHNIKSNGYSLTNKDWESSVQIKRTAIEDDTYGIYTPMTQMMAKTAAEHPDVQVYSLLNNGFTATCWDGLPFFSAAHTLRTDKDGVAVTFNNTNNIALSGLNFSTVRAEMLQNLQGGDTPFMSGAVDLVLVCGTALETTARQILLAEYDDLGQTNVYKGMAKLHVSAQITGNYWFLLVTNNPIMPLIYQHRQDVDIRYPEYSDYEAKKTNYFDFMADYRAAFGYGLPILAYGSTGSN